MNCNCVGRTAALLAAALLCAVGATAAPLPPAHAQRVDDAIGRCFELRDRAPGDAITLARATLASPGLTSDDEIKLLACLARAEALSGRTEDVVATVDRIEALLLAEPRPAEFTLRALSNAGAALHVVGDVSRALELYRRAFEAAQAGEADLAQVKMLINVASIQSEHLDAYDLAERTYAQAQQIADASGVVEPLLPYNHATNLLRLDRPDQARLQFEAALASSRASPDTVLTRRIQTELVALGRADDASARLQTLADAQRDDDPSGAAITLVRMADLALADGRPDAARVHAAAAVALAATGIFARERRDALRMRVRALHASGDLETAFTALDALHAEERDAARRLQLGALAELQARLEDGRSAAELAHLRETQRIDVINARHARTLRAVGATALGVLVLLALALAFYQRRSVGDCDASARPTA
ncbi:hypothetical protein CMZ82_12275 [Lysobacteraceae bacterium NML93-0792]|nr:hypothetical protein CMZ82_12275 [Xanthomonadaceae bacterium NML93-0792]PBS16188.1 hypothetical protein CMZ81_07675 [Xanthomonadaceae bacterium NML93-0793]PBS20214.1 hypothetical protein CMZ80_04440 [Xanthomonadaceae bacterium NML93-0831]